MSLLEKQLVVKQSNIARAGKGLFTMKAIPKGKRIIEYKGRIIAWKEVAYDSDNAYLYYVNRNHVIDASIDKKEMGRYCNDAKGSKKIKGLTNNCKFVKDGLRVFIQATKDIPAEAELFVGYGKEYWHGAPVRRRKKRTKP
jgi:SET domain-containing protein